MKTSNIWSRSACAALILSLAGASTRAGGGGSQASAPRWPQGYTLARGETPVASPDGTLGFIVPTNERYEKGERCKVVNLKTGALVHPIEHGEYWNEGDGGLSNGGLAPKWKADPDRRGAWLCVVEFTGKWEPRNLTLLEIGPGARFVETDLWELVESAFAKHFRGKIPDRAFNEHRSFLLTEAEITWAGAATVVFKALADSNPKDMEDQPRYSCPVTARYDVRARSLQIQAGKLDVRKAKPQ